MTAIYSTESCLDCKYWKRGDIYGECRRFPISENKHQNSWCGEYYSLTPSKNEPNPKDRKLCIKVINETFDEVYSEYTKKVINQPKRGRPAKVKV